MEAEKSLAQKGTKGKSPRMSYSTTCPLPFSVDKATQQEGEAVESQGLRGQPEKVYSSMFSPLSLRLSIKEKPHMQTTKKGKCAERGLPLPRKF